MLFDFAPLALFVAVSATLMRLLTTPLLRGLVLAALNFGFLWALSPDLGSTVPLLIYAGIGALGVALTARRRNAAAMWLSIVALLAGYVALKKIDWGTVGSFAGVSAFDLGCSYVMFRVIQVVVDLREGSLDRPPSVLEFWLYTFFFPTLVAGPIQRWQDFSEQLRAGPQEQISEAEALAAMERFVEGFLKAIVGSAAALALHGRWEGRIASAPDPVSAGMLWALAAAAYAVYLYFNFSGYCDIVIAAARLMGFRLPENFDRPFKARNFLELWQRWHISLSEWFRFYFFNPLLKALTARWPTAGAAPWLAAVAFFATFFVIGVWHGMTPAFLVYGVFLGAGAAGNKLWQVLMAKRLGRQRWRTLSADRVYAGLARGLTFSYFAVALTCFWRDLGGIGELLRAVGPVGFVCMVLTLGACAAVFAEIYDRLEAVWMARSARARSALAAPGPRSLFVGLGAVLAFGFSLAQSGAPEFVYRQF